MVADLTRDNSSLLEIQDIERLIQSSQFHFLPSVPLPTLLPTPHLQTAELFEFYAS